tara:strand:- start:122 stop:763 length:642 start_codon:yes stop_codon:yes gene_type:complete
MDKKQNWHSFFLPNIFLYETKLSDDVINRLWSYIEKAENKVNHVLAGNITSSYDLVDEDDYFFNKILKPVSHTYVSENSNVNYFQSNHEVVTKKENLDLCLGKFWVNNQYKHEFNPMHTHSGVLSFVIWLKIPTNWEDQHNLPIAKNSNSPSVSDFSFAYTDILGNIQSYKIQLSPKDNGLMVIFPSSLNHEVYPFYNCDEERVSISGNIYHK